MTGLLRVRVALTGFQGQPGVSTFYFLDVATAMTSLHTLWGGIASKMPQGSIVTVPNVGDIIEDTTGDITGQWLGDPVTGIPAGGGLERYAGGTGACITWLTGSIVASHRVRGRTFAVPLVTTAFDVNGTLDDTYRTALETAALGFQVEQSASFVIWARPFAGKAQVGQPGQIGFRPARPARVGSHALVTGSRVIDQAAILKSRRQ